MILSHDRIEHISHTCYVTSLRPLFRPWIISFPEAVYLFKIILQISFSLTFTILISYLKIFQKVMIVTREGVKTFWQRLINFRQGRGVFVCFSVKTKHEEQKRNCMYSSNLLLFLNYSWITFIYDNMWHGYDNIRQHVTWLRQHTTTCDMVITAIAQLYFYKTMRLRDISR